MRAHIFLQCPAAVPLESACLAVVTYRQTLVFCASFPGGDFFGACPKPHRAMHGSMSGFAGVGDIRGLPKRPTRWRCRPWYSFAQRAPRQGQPTGRGTPQILRRDLSARSAGHSPGTCRALPQPRSACTGPPRRGGSVGRQKASDGSWAQVRSRALTTCSQAVILGSS